MAFQETHGNSGVMMGGDGPVMSGTWVNPKTGHKFTVRDCYFQDGNFIVQTTEGQMLDYNTIKNYVQASSTDAPTQQSKPKQQAAPRKSNNDVPQEVLDQLLPEDEELIRGTGKGLGNINTPRRADELDDFRTPPPRMVHQPAPVQEIDTDQAMIKRVLDSHPNPELNATIDWANRPDEQITTLVNVLGVDPKVIASYYIAKLDQDAIFEHIKEMLSEYLADLATPKQTPTPDAPESEQSQEKKTTQKKKSSKKK